MEEFPRFSFVRSEIARRLGWFLASQSFLFSGLGIAHAGGVAAPAHANNVFFLFTRSWGRASGAGLAARWPLLP